MPDYFITGTIYRDGNRSGALDSDEKLSKNEGVSVQLRDKDGNVIATTHD